MENIEIKRRFKNSAKRALLGNVNSAIRGIGVRLDGAKLVVKCYVNRIPPEEDYESLNDISGEILGDFYFDELEEICEYSTEAIEVLERIDDMVIVKP